MASPAAVSLKSRWSKPGFLSANNCTKPCGGTKDSERTWNRSLLVARNNPASGTGSVADLLYSSSQSEPPVVELASHSFMARLVAEPVVEAIFLADGVGTFNCQTPPRPMRTTV